MATFTFRIPDSMAGRLTSAEMRSWLAQFLRTPYPLPPDPGSGYERVSLTLPRELVRDVAGYLRCSPSIALRRIAAAYLGGHQAPIPAPLNRTAVPVTAMPLTPAREPCELSPPWDCRSPADDTPASNPTVGEMVASLVIQALICVLIVGAVMFFSTRKNGAGKAA